jgi:hypothetical protein
VPTQFLQFSLKTLKTVKQMEQMKFMNCALVPEDKNAVKELILHLDMSE